MSCQGDRKLDFMDKEIRKADCVTFIEVELKLDKRIKSVIIAGASVTIQG
ncbi:MAG: hypothetical protein K8S62_07400 [Candidatus Sabulitectum sp.]|nr:hypothetical protein [Candidatus Sabulitectum sp.]